MSTAAISAINPIISTQLSPSPTSEIVKKIAITCLKEFALSLTIGLVVCCFVPDAIGIVIIASAAVVQLAVSIFFHSLGAYAENKVRENRGNRAQFEKILKICQMMTGANFALFTGLNAQTLIHETGHSLAALALYKRPIPQIEISPFAGGNTQFYKSALSALGKKIGPVATTCIVIASGPAFTLMVSSVLLTVGLIIRQTRPHLSSYLLAWSCFDFLSHAQYAYSALGTQQWNLSHDFVHLSVFGLHPIAAATAILAIPVVIGLGVHWWERKKEPPLQAAL